MSINLLISIARVVASYFAFVEIGGFVWFSESQNVQTTVYFITTFIALCIFAALPRRMLASYIIRLAIGVIGIVAIVSSIPMMIDDLKSIYEPHYPAFVLRLLVCGIAVLMVWEAKFLGKRRREQRRGQA